jgi:hypothetical protein
VSTWINIFLIIGSVEIPFADKLTSLFFAATTSIVLGLVLVWCQFAALPPVAWFYWVWSERFGGDLSLVNSIKPNYFKLLTQEQIDAAHNALAGPPIPFPKNEDAPTVREFNLDIAKLLLQFASIVYERKNKAIFESIDHSKTEAANSTGSSLFSLFSTPDLLAPATKKILSGDHFHDKILGRLQKKGLNKTKWGNNVIDDFCRLTGVGYAPISELQTSESAFCSFFWDPKGKWIVVTFKGTGPTEYADWIADLTTSLTQVDDYLPKFSQAVKGFKNRLYPEGKDARIQGTGLDKPWDRISKMLTLLAKQMIPHLAADEKINVWFTGHSLGCALAGLGYTRSIHPEEFDESRIRIRDAYIFAAPILGDRPTTQRFNALMNEGEYVKTVWRITNADDLVATGLPQLGDNPNLNLSPSNPAGFAHIGAEIKMKDHPTPSQFTGSLFSHDTVVSIASTFSPEEVVAQRQKLLADDRWLWIKEKLGVWAEEIPLIGRLIAHTPALYWDQLTRVVPGDCVYIKGY